MGSTLKEQVVRELDQMSESELRKILNSARGVKSELPGSITVGQFLERFGGTIPEEELTRMDAAIEEAFEQVDADGG